MDRGDHYKREAFRMMRRKDKFKRKWQASLGLNCALSVWCVSLLITTNVEQPPRVSNTRMVADHRADVTGATVNFRGCSGTIIGIDGELAYGVSAAHCGFRVGQVAGAINSRGQSINVRIRAIDHKDDLALFVVYSRDVANCVGIPETLGATSEGFEAVGHPGGQRAQAYKVLKDGRSAVIDNRPVGPRWNFRVVSGQFGPGDSGGGVFSDGKLVGVISDQNTGDPSQLYCCPHAHLVRFVRRNMRNDCWKWGCPPQRRDETPIPPPPVLADPPPAPAPAPIPAPAPEPVPLPTPNNDAVLQELRDLRRRIDDLQLKEGPRGPKGDKGEPGEPGESTFPPGIDASTIKDLQVADQRMASDLSTIKREVEILRKNLEQLDKGVKENAIADKNAAVDVQRLSDRVSVIERRMSGSVRITVRRDPKGQYSVTKPLQE